MPDAVLLGGQRDEVVSGGTSFRDPTQPGALIRQEFLVLLWVELIVRSLKNVVAIKRQLPQGRVAAGDSAQRAQLRLAAEGVHLVRIGQSRGRQCGHQGECSTSSAEAPGQQ